MHKELPPKLLFIVSVAFLVIAFLSRVFSMASDSSMVITIFFGIFGFTLLFFSILSVLHEHKKTRALSSKELFIISIVCFIAGYLLHDALFQLIALLTFFFGISTYHRERTFKKK